jgi:energy-coupling factor transporter ATP-binding protein EcfA2
MRLSVKYEDDGASSSVRPELSLHGDLTWSEHEGPEEIWSRPARLIDVKASPFLGTGLPFRSVASLDLIAPDALDFEAVMSALRGLRGAVLQEPETWKRDGSVWVRWSRNEKVAPHEVQTIDRMIAAADQRLGLRNARVLLRVEQVALKDFRGFEQLTFTPGGGRSTVLVGSNGSGKSTVLDATWHLLAEIERRHHDGSGSLRDDDLRNDRDFTNISIRAALGGSPVEWTIGRSRGRHSPNDVRRQPLDSLLSVERAELQSCPPILVHYTVDRRVRAISPKVLSHDESIPDTHGDLRLFFQWFREREDIENETRIHDSAHRDPQLQAVRRAVPALIPGFENLRVQRNPLRMLVNKGDYRLYVDQLSDGEKGLLALAGDVARRLAAANPYADDPLRGGGVVLIDEVELHLHPAWQRRIIPALEKTFPNCQFILTTHSPQVLSSVPHEHVVLLSKFRRVEHIPYTEGRDSNAILGELMGVSSRPEDAANEIERLAELIDAEDLDSAERKIEELSKRFGPDDRDLIRFGAMLRALRESAA